VNGVYYSIKTNLRENWYWSQGINCSL
jgi:hypothetical protein